MPPQSIFEAKVTICGNYLFLTFNFNIDIARPYNNV